MDYQREIDAWRYNRSSLNRANWIQRTAVLRNAFSNIEFGSRSFDHSPFVPILSVVMLVITVLLLILFRQNPGLVAGTVAGCLIVIGMYLTLNTIEENKVTFE
ncbi:PREDICTED: uncharacterized protein LOC108560767 [Nicrophorus vespilloides]|uniref:Uncharacterized protein LOC108560767 n=1 Tax=Nicrophorus vespilloides TaxID=110193 RepID=A0ABM1MH90_NICVS|nr:PREDICTED: uncharacterized protein LOC108560767 [Nicrophorus vespilloides]